MYTRRVYQPGVVHILNILARASIEEGFRGCSTIGFMKRILANHALTIAMFLLRMIVTSVGISDRVGKFVLSWATFFISLMVSWRSSTGCAYQKNQSQDLKGDCFFM
ncbi:hypothetical protein HUJ04_002356 [Dendroctonus ponderosae]|nr:hypothetical protein HUJ04_002356 [Dendroctonus ponderosae]